MQVKCTGRRRWTVLRKFWLVKTRVNHGWCASEKTNYPNSQHSAWVDRYKSCLYINAWCYFLFNYCLKFVSVNVIVYICLILHSMQLLFKISFCSIDFLLLWSYTEDLCSYLCHYDIKSLKQTQKIPVNMSKYNHAYTYCFLHPYLSSAYSFYWINVVPTFPRVDVPVSSDEIYIIV